MRASALCCFLACFVSSALAFHHPLHKHRHDKGKRTEVLGLEEETIVEEIDVTIYLPGPPPDGFEQHQEAREREHEGKEYSLTTYALPDGSVTVVSGPKPTHSGSVRNPGKGKLHATPSNPKTTRVASGAGEASPSHSSIISSIASDPGSDSTSSSLAGSSSSPGSEALSAGFSTSLKSLGREHTASFVVDYTPSASTAADSPATTTAPACSVAPANGSPASAMPSSTVPPSHNGAYPFTALVAFGDNLSDNGNGSYAHNVAANSPTDVVDGNKIYGARTWTNGPVAVSYLTDLLGVPMNQNFAFGHAWGGSHFGATIDDTVQQSNFSASLEDGPWFNSGRFSEPCWGAPSAKIQINDYIKGGVNKEALHFLWIGANDMDAAYKGTLGINNPTVNDDFAGNISTKIPDLVITLLDAGAPYVLVANLYPKHLAPL